MAFREQDPVGGTKITKALLVRTEDFENPRPNIKRPMLTIWLYLVEVNRVTRPGWSGVGYLDGKGHLPLDLHFLMTPWGDNAEDEYKILGKTMEALEANPILSGPLLHEDANWAPNEAVQIIAGDLGIDTLMQTFDSLQADYKLSVPYLSRVVRIDTKQTVVDTPVTTIVRGTTPSSTPNP